MTRIKGITPSAIYMGMLAAFVGYSASFAIVLAALKSMGASTEQAAIGLFFATLGMGVCSIWLPYVTRVPTAVAWSTPGAAFLAASSVLSGGFEEAIGALIICSGLIVATALIPRLALAVSTIPKPLANALLAGVLLNLCLAPATSLGTLPELTVPVLVAWVVGLMWHRLLAMPLAVGAFLVVLFLSAEPSIDAAASHPAWLVSAQPVWPSFSLTAAISVAFPLYLVTMAGQNIPGFAVLELNGYKVDRAFLLRNTGLVSLGIAPFGGIPVNMSAITASMMAGEDACQDPTTRYWAAIASGTCYVALAFFAVYITRLIDLAPLVLVTALAGLALIPAFVGACKASFDTSEQLEAPALTFLISGSGISLLGINGAVWGLFVGTAIWYLKSGSKKI